MENIARKIRIKALEMQHNAGKGHLGGALSSAEIVTCLYCSGIVNISPKNRKSPSRDRVIFSKGHACFSLYAALAIQGFFSEKELDTYGKNGSILGGHPDHFIPGVEVSTGSLGHGLGIGAGMALSGKINKQNYSVYVLLGDGECTEGSIWEAAAFSSAQKLTNLIAIVDNNGVAATDATNSFTGHVQMEEKWKSFGWDTLSVNGHDIPQIIAALKKTKKRTASSKPLAIIAHTVKGRGVSFMEGDPHWHHGVANDAQYQEALKELA